MDRTIDRNSLVNTAKAQCHQSIVVLLANLTSRIDNARKSPRSTASRDEPSTSQSSFMR
ncbi:hypothetical protein ACMFWY_23750 [Roseiconus sp. JC912]|uniref:hypothetical protein n=1 Tax=Roseiconus sp. JC912 TaxID=3396307 RepID=UPI003A4C6EB3